MTRDEFKAKFEVLITEFNSSNNNEFDVLIFGINTTTGQGFHSGYGCPACIAEVVQAALKAGVIKHNEKEEVMN